MNNLSKQRFICYSLFLIICAFLGVKITQAQSISFTRTLTVGSSGADVMYLQKILNSNPETAVSHAGPGSSGQETAYFGAKTAQAVVKFQQLYAAKILAPNGLSVGTGVVGPSTRAMLAEIANPNPVADNSGHNSTNNWQNTLKTALSTTTATTTSSNANPNLKNLSYFLSAIDKVAIEKGISVSSLVPLKKQIYADVLSTTTDLQKEFLSIAAKNAATSTADETIFSKAISYISAPLKRLFYPHVANAIGDTPFGGQLYYSFFCTCSGNWLLTVEPLAPSYVTLLTYQIGSQVYLGYNIPITTQLLGSYTSGGQCQVYVGTACSSLPQEGQITAQTGSSEI